MAARKKTKRIAEFGDFQTPLTLARKACKALASTRIEPVSIVEPTCGHGSFLLAALEAFPTAEKAVGLDVNLAYIENAERLLLEHEQSNRAELLQADFFAMDWPKLLSSLPDPILVVGNPPWVTNAELGALGSTNLPKKSNFQGHGGFDAMTGKANFDISQWMMMKLLDWLDGRKATLAMLCKTSVARKVMLHAWKNGVAVHDASMRGIDAGESFGVSVDACLLVCNLAPNQHNVDCDVHERLGDEKKPTVIGYREKKLIANIESHERWKHLRGTGVYRWRSGVKHDCSKVMEFRRQGSRYVNGLGEVVDLEDDYLYPMLKSSQVANGRTKTPDRWMLVTQKSIGEATSVIESTAPKTWQYLLDHGELLDKRASSIYRKRPRFSVFGVGDYSFAPYKVAISGFYKRLSFAKLGSVDDKPIMLDDTCYFVDCYCESEADLIAALLNSETARAFFAALIFWDSKRPITVDVLRQLDLLKLARETGKEDALLQYVRQRPGQGASETGQQQLSLFDEEIPASQ